MRRQTIRGACFLAILGSALAAPATKAGDFDPEAISQISKGISEWKLLHGEKDESEVERTVYVSSSLGGRTAPDAAGRPAVVRGLRAFSQDQVDPILWYGTSDWIKPVPIYRDYSLPSPGAWDPRGPSSRYGEVSINPNYMGQSPFAKPYTPGGPDPDIVMAHEIGHVQFEQFDRAYSAVSRTPRYVDSPLYNIRTEAYADQYAQDFDKTRQARFTVENRIAQDLRSKGANVKVYSSYQDYRLDQSAWRSRLDNIPIRSRDVGGATLPSPSSQVNWSTLGRNSSVDSSRMNVDAGAMKWSTGAGVTSSSITRTTVGPPIPSTVRYPPPDVLFRIKDPLTSYTSPMPKSTISPYSPYTVPTIPTYKPPPTLPSPRLGGS